MGYKIYLTRIVDRITECISSEVKNTNASLTQQLMTRLQNASQWNLMTGILNVFYQRLMTGIYNLSHHS